MSIFIEIIIFSKISTHFLLVKKATNWIVVAGKEEATFCALVNYNFLDLFVSLEQINNEEIKKLIHIKGVHQGRGYMSHVKNLLKKKKSWEKMDKSHNFRFWPSGGAGGVHPHVARHFLTNPFHIYEEAINH